MKINLLYLSLKYLLILVNMLIYYETAKNKIQDILNKSKEIKK